MDTELNNKKQFTANYFKKVKIQLDGNKYT